MTKKQNWPLSDDLVVTRKSLQELIYWARRYCDGRSTYSPSSFNDILYGLMGRYPDIEEGVPVDATLTNSGEFWPWAQDGQYEKNCRGFDARPIELRLCDGCHQVKIFAPAGETISKCDKCKEKEEGKCQK